MTLFLLPVFVEIIFLKKMFAQLIQMKYLMFFTQAGTTKRFLKNVKTKNVFLNFLCEFERIFSKQFYFLVE